MDDKVFPTRLVPLNNPEGKQTMVRVERHSNYTPQKGLDGGDVFFFDTWEEALEWMKADYYENSGGWSMTRDERVEFNREHVSPMPKIFIPICLLVVRKNQT